MKYQFLGPITVLLFSTACQQPQSTDDPEKLKKVLLDYFEGIRDKDFKKMLDATTDDFILYEDGSVWNNDSAFINIRSHIPFTVEYKLDNFKIHVDQMSGDMTYYNHGEFVFKNNKRRGVDWIESATFRKTEKGWKMNFLQATERR